MTSQSERVLLEEDGITVTTSRIQASGNQYPGVLIPLSGVASVFEFGSNPGVKARHAALAWAFAFYLMAIFLVITSQGTVFIGPLALVASLIFLASRPGSPVWKAVASRRRVVEIADKAGTVHTIRVRNFGVGVRVYAAISAALREA